MMNSTAELSDSGTRGKAALEREGDEIREDIDRTLDALERKFSPDQLVDRSIGFLRENGSALLQEVGATVRGNPIPVLLSAAGLIWLTGSLISHRPGKDAPGSGAIPRGRKPSQAFNERGAQRGARSATESRDRVGAAASAVKAKVSDAVDGVRAHTLEVSTNFSTLVREQPLALGALAVATGALIGAALPMSRYENDLLGDAHDRTIAKVRAVGQQEYERVRDSVVHAFDDASAPSEAKERDLQDDDGSAPAHS